MQSVKQGSIKQVPFFESLVWLDLGIEHQSPSTKKQEKKRNHIRYHEKARELWRLRLQSIRQKLSGYELLKINISLSMKRPITIDFLEKSATLNSTSYCKLLRQYFTLSIEWLSYIHQLELSKQSSLIIFPSIPSIHLSQQVFLATSQACTELM